MNHCTLAARSENDVSGNLFLVDHDFSSGPEPEGVART